MNLVKIKISVYEKFKKYVLSNFLFLLLWDTFLFSNVMGYLKGKKGKKKKESRKDK